MLQVPTYLQKRECVPLNSRFGKFLKRYYLKHSNSKIEEEVAKGINFSQMSKLQFLKDYMLNPDYTIEDFLNVKDPSLRGFIFETLWDVCFKCNVVDNYNQPGIEHLQGKIEDVRIQIAELKNQWQKDKEHLKGDKIDFDQKKAEYKAKLKALEDVFNSKDSDYTHLARDFIDKKKHLRAISDLYDYLKMSKVQSGSTAGISDITMKYGGKFVLVSSKYYIDEKAVNQYDIAAIIQSVRGFSSKCKIVLVVKDKPSLLKNIERSHKHETVNTISDILDTSHLRRSLHMLQRVCSRLAISFTTDALKFEENFRSYFKKTFKPFLSLSFEAKLLKHGLEKAPKGNTTSKYFCFDKRIASLAVLGYIDQYRNVPYKIACVDDKPFKQLIEEHFDLRSLPLEFKSSKLASKYDVILTAENTRIAFMTSTELCNTSWDISKVICQQNLDMPHYQEKFKKEFPYLDDVVKEHYGEDNLDQDVYKKIKSDCQYPRLHAYTNEKKNYNSKSFSTYKDMFGIDVVINTPEMTSSIIALLLGDKFSYHEPFIFRNRFEKHPDYSKPTSHLWVIPEAAKGLVIQAVKRNVIAQKEFLLLSGMRGFRPSERKQIVLVNAQDIIESSDKVSLFQVLVVLDDKLHKDSIVHLLSSMMLYNKGAIHYVDLTLSRASEVCKILDLPEWS